MHWLKYQSRKRGKRKENARVCAAKKVSIDEWPDTKQHRKIHAMAVTSR